MPAECLARLMDFVSATHAALRIGVYAGELRRRFEAAVVEEAILPSNEDREAEETRAFVEAIAAEKPCRCTEGFTCTPCLYARERRTNGAQGRCESPAGRLENELRKALAICEAKLRAVNICIADLRKVAPLLRTVGDRRCDALADLADGVADELDRATRVQS
jgi:hypothetical protein